MAIVTLVPNELIANLGEWVPVGGNVAQVLSDGSDATYVESPEENGLEVRVGFTSTVLPAHAQARKVTVRLRGYHQNSVPIGTFDVVGIYMWWGPRGRPRDFRSEIFLSRSPVTHEANPHDEFGKRTNNGRMWTQDEIDTLTVGYLVGDPALSAGVRITEGSIELVTNEVPVVSSVGGVNDPETGSSRPTITYVYSDPEGDAQERLRVRVFSQDQYSAPDFDPAESLSVWDSRVVSSSIASRQIDNYLSNGIRYRAYVIVGDVGSDNRLSPYGPYVEWTQDVPEPAVPTMTLSPNETENRMEIGLIGNAGAVATTTFLVERSDDGGVTYAQVLEVPNDFASNAGYDYTAPRNDAIWYRARALHFDEALARLTFSDYTAPQSTLLPYDGQVWLKSVSDPALNTTVCLSTHELDSDSLQVITSNIVIGNRFPQIGLRTIYRDTFDSLPLAFLDDATYEAFEHLRSRQETLLLQTCYGDTLKEQWFLRIGESRTTKAITAPTAPTQLRLVEFRAFEVDPPPQSNVALQAISVDPGGYQTGYSGGY